MGRVRQAALRLIASAFVERFITDPEPTLFSTGSGGPVRRKNNFVVAISTNFGTFSEDLMNRSLPIHLAPSGNVADRKSPIGNPKLEFLPRNRDRIEAELTVPGRCLTSRCPQQLAFSHHNKNAIQFALAKPTIFETRGSTPNETNDFGSSLDYDDPPLADEHLVVQGETLCEDNLRFATLPQDCGGALSKH